ncbi:hypothetical protein QTP88_013150 [Uroleucon formosanum]
MPLQVSDDYNWVFGALDDCGCDCRRGEAQVQQQSMAWVPNSKTFLKCLQYTKTDLGILQYKDTLDILKPFRSIRLLRQGQARASFTPPESYTKPLPITEAKKKD